MNAGVKWSDESTREFIQLRYKLRHLFNGRKHQCEKAYSRIVDELGLRNVISPTQARKKWSNLLQKYMDIKGGYSTASPDWPYFQILDQIVPLMRKEKIEKLSPSGVESKDLDSHESLPSPLTSAPDTEGLAMPGVQGIAGDDKCKTEAADTGEPPRKRGRGRRAAQRARDRWWGAVEDSDLGSDSVASAGRTELPSQLPCKSTVDALEASQMELQTFGMLESCATALTEIRDILKAHTEQQERFMQTLQQTVSSHSSTVKEVLNTVSSQNATLINLLTHLTKSAHTPLGITPGNSFGEEKLRRDPATHSHQEEGQLLASQQNLISALTQRQQGCESPLVEATELTDSITGL
ncbi:hypothetical protein O3P69_014687 [Scylla paramamosain]|uniref:Myb/SANT-like DNA-binding domain-containing protein n=2 Tax=Scylla paramamosain TaxID=85552 RepID=A0AAW0TXK9_SCYPA